MNRRRKFLIASIVAIQNSSFIYPSCQKCFSKVILVSKRFDCPKCGCTGEAKNVTYRYKLSLKVSDTNRLFSITIFGSCLDTFFGITATCLNRYIKDSNQVEGALDSNSIQDILIQAVQACFIGKTFIFGVTNFENQGEQALASNNLLQKWSHDDGHIRELVACQISLPNSDVTGYTVINYFDQLLQSANFRNIHCDPQLPDSHLLEGDHPSSELSSLGSSGSSSSFIQSSGRDHLSRLWQQFLGLPPIVTQPADDEDFSISEQSKVDGVLLQQKERVSSDETPYFGNCHELTWDSHSPHLSLDEATNKGKLDTESNDMTVIPNNCHEDRAANNWDSFCPLKTKQPLEENTTNLLGSLQKEEKCSQSKLTHHQDHNLDLSSNLPKRTSFTTLSPSHAASNGNTQEEDPEIWDDLPFSESLNAFMAVIENENTIAQAKKCSIIDKDISPLDSHCDKLFTNPQKAAGNTCVSHMRPQVKYKNCEGNGVLSTSGSKMNPGSQKKRQLNNIASCSSTSINGKEISDTAMPNVSLSVLPETPKAFRTYHSFKKIDSFLQSKVEIIPSPNTSWNVHSHANTKYSVKCGGRRSLETDRTATSLCSEKHVVFSGACHAGNKRFSIWPQNQEGSFTTCRELVQNSNTHSSNKNESTNVFALMAGSQGIPCTTAKKNFLQNHSPGHDSSYNASADLFDISTKETGEECIDKSQDVLSTLETVLTGSHPLSNFPHSPLDNNCTHFQRRSSQNILSCSRTHSSPPYFQSDSDYDLGDSQEFVPYLQSTPIAPLHHRLRVHKMKESFKKDSKLYINCKESALSYEDGLQQPTPNCLKNEKTTSPRPRNASIANDSQQMLISSSPTIKFLETNFDDWVHHTTKKAFLSPVLPTSEMLRLNSRAPGKWPAACSNPNQTKGPQNKKRQMEQKTDEDLIGKGFHLKNKNRVTTVKEITPKLENNKDSGGWSSKNAALRTDSCSNVKCRLSFSENETPPAIEVPNNWSPELFTQSRQNSINKHLLKIPIWKL